MVHEIKNKRGDIIRISFKKRITFSQFQSALKGKNVDHLDKLYEQITGKKVSDGLAATSSKSEKDKSGKSGN